jgi:hypothetical protein
METISPVVSIIALAVSLFTAWYTILRRGSVRSMHPSFIAFRYDFIDKPVAQAKVFLRTLLFSTGKRGLVIEKKRSRIFTLDNCHKRTSQTFTSYGFQATYNLSVLYMKQ